MTTMRIATLISCALLTSGVSAHAQGYDWSGAYAGASVGAAWVDTGVSTELTNFWNVPSDQVDRDSLLPLLNGGLNGENVSPVALPLAGMNFRSISHS